MKISKIKHRNLFAGEFRYKAIFYPHYPHTKWYDSWKLRTARNAKEYTELLSKDGLVLIPYHKKLVKWFYDFNYRFEAKLKSFKAVGLTSGNIRVNDKSLILTTNDLEELTDFCKIFQIDEAYEVEVIKKVFLKNPKEKYRIYFKSGAYSDELIHDFCHQMIDLHKAERIIISKVARQKMLWQYNLNGNVSINTNMKGFNLKNTEFFDCSDGAVISMITMRFPDMVDNVMWEIEKIGV